jgi:hypothetical protein
MEQVAAQRRTAMERRMDMQLSGKTALVNPARDEG